MIQTENTALVLRRVNYRDNDRMVTLLSPSRGRIDAVIRNCRKPKSHNLNAAELFALATTGRTGELMPPKNQEVGSPQSLNLLVP